MKRSFASICAKDIERADKNRSHVLPIVQSAAFDFESVEEGMAIFKKQAERKGLVYSRYDNPTVKAVADKIAELECFDTEEEGEALFFGSGMAALSVTFQALLKPGDALLASRLLYGGTTELLRQVVGKNGVRIVFADFSDPEELESKLEKEQRIRMLFYESPANPGLECVNMEKTDRLAKKYGALHVVDNTVCTPYLQRPLNYGADLVVHSTTKYLNGHGTATGGIVVSKNKALVNEQLWPVLKLMGPTPSPFDAWMLHNGLKTLVLRMDRQSSNAMAVAKYLDSDQRIQRVNYLGLESHPDHQLAKLQMAGFGGLLSFYPDGDKQRCIRFMNSLRLCSLTPTLGDLDTLVLHPATSSHMNIPENERMEAGITENMIRLSVGIEDEQDIITDLDNALRSAF